MKQNLNCKSHTWISILYKKQKFYTSRVIFNIYISLFQTYYQYKLINSNSLLIKNQFSKNIFYPMKITELFGHIKFWEHFITSIKMNTFNYCITDATYWLCVRSESGTNTCYYIKKKQILQIITGVDESVSSVCDNAS
jgi:hypothetical protein